MKLRPSRSRFTAVDLCAHVQCETWFFVWKCTHTVINFSSNRQEEVMDEFVRYSQHKDVSLDPRLKDAVRANIVDFMQQRFWHAHLPQPAPGLSLFSMQKAAFAFVIFIMCGAGIASAAENALPGDLLYSVKVHVYEPMIVGVRFSEETMARREADLAVKRMEEMQELAERHALSEDAYTIVKERLEHHVRQAHSYIEEVSSQEGEQKAARLRLHVQNRLLPHAVNLTIPLTEDKESFVPPSSVSATAIAGGSVASVDAVASGDVNENMVSSMSNAITKSLSSLPFLSGDIRAEVNIDGSHVGASVTATHTGSASLDLSVTAESNIDVSLHTGSVSVPARLRRATNEEETHSSSESSVVVETTNENAEAFIDTRIDSIRDAEELREEVDEMIEEMLNNLPVRPSR